MEITSSNRVALVKQSFCASAMETNRSAREEIELVTRPSSKTKNARASDNSEIVAYDEAGFEFRMFIQFEAIVTIGVAGDLR